MEDFLTYMQEEQTLAKECLLKAKDYLAEKNASAFAEELNDCILHKLLIADVAAEEKNIEELSRLSLLTIAQKSDGKVVGDGVSLKCSGPDAVEQKKVLLLLYIQSSFEVKIPAVEIVELESTTELALAIMKVWLGTHCTQ